MEKTKSYKTITNQGKKIKSIWLDISKKYNVPIEIKGIDSICSFNFVGNNSLVFKAIFISEMLKKNFLANTTVMVSISHTDKILQKYRIAVEKTFNIISKYRKINSSKYDKLKLPVTGFYRLN